MSTTSQERAHATDAEAPVRRRSPWWLLLLGLAVIAVVVVLLSRGGDTPSDTAAPDDQAATQDDESASGAETGSDATSGDPDVVPGKVTAGGATVYPLEEDLTMADYADLEVVGEGVPVESVVADEGFWIGESAQDRVFVLLTAGTALPEVGDTIDFEGVVVEHEPTFADEVGVDGDEGASRLNALLGHIEIETFELAG